MRFLLLSAGALALAACSETIMTTPEASGSVVEPAAVEEVEVAYGRAGTYRLDRAHSSLIWRVSHFGLSQYTGHFTEFDATLEMNPDDPSASQLMVTINPLAVETNYRGDYKGTHPGTAFESWNEDLALNERWFNGAQFPEIAFTSTEITPVTATTGKVTGDLTFLGVTRPVTLDVTYNGVTSFPWAPDSDKIGFSARAVINRSEFGQTALIPNIGDEVEIIIETEFGEVRG